MARPQALRRSLPSLWRVVRYLGPYLRARRGLLAGSSVALVAEIALRLLEPWPLKLVFDHVIPSAATAGSLGIAALDRLGPLQLLTVAAGAVVAISGLRALANYVTTIGFALVGSRVVTDVRAQVFSHLQALSLSFHTRARGGDLLTRLIGDVGVLKEVAVTALLPLVANLLTLVGMLALMFWLHWTLALLALAIIPLFWLSATRASRRIRDVARAQRHREGAMAAAAAESIGAIKTVQALSLEGTFARVFSGANEESLTEGVKASRLAARLERGVDALIAVATALVLWYGTLLVLRAALSPGELLVFLTYLKSAFKPVRDFAKYTGRLSRAAAAGERVLELLEHAPEIHDVPDAVPAPSFRGAVRLERVSFAYEPGHPALLDIDLELWPGAHAALVGPSGSGKSTIVSLLLRLYDPTAGRVIIDGHDIREYTIESVRAQVSVVLQDTLLFATSVRENIAAGAPGVTSEAIEAAARLANAHAFIEALPRGYDTILGERGVTLSNGQRQRISIARAAVRQAPILVLDEPTVGLDDANESEVTQALERLSRSRTTLVITHDLRRAATADLILYVENGRIPERGTHAELLRAGGRYATLYHLQDSGRHRHFPHVGSHVVGR